VLVKFIVILKENLGHINQFLVVKTIFVVEFIVILNKNSGWFNQFLVVSTINFSGVFTRGYRG